MELGFERSVAVRQAWCSTSLNPTSWEAEAGGIFWVWSVWSREWISGQPGLHSESLYFLKKVIIYMICSIFVLLFAFSIRLSIALTYFLDDLRRHSVRVMWWFKGSSGFPNVIMSPPSGVLASKTSCKHSKAHSERRHGANMQIQFLMYHNEQQTYLMNYFQKNKFKYHLQ